MKKTYHNLSYVVKAIRDKNLLSAADMELFVFESSFLDRYEVDKETLEKIKQDEIALLKFGMKWLRDVLYKEGIFQLKPDAAQKRKV